MGWQTSYFETLPIAPVTESLRFWIPITCMPLGLESLDVSSVIERLDRLHQGASSAFRRIATKKRLMPGKGGQLMQRKQNGRQQPRLRRSLHCRLPCLRARVGICKVVPFESTGNSV